MLKDKALGAIYWSSIGQWGYRALSFVIFIILSRLLTPEAFGILSIALIYVALMQVFLEQGLLEALIQKEDINEKVLNTSFWTNIIISFGLFFFSLIIAPWVASIFDEERLTNIIRGLSISFLFVAPVLVHKAILRRELNFRLLTKASISGIFIGGVIGIISALLGLEVWALVLFQIILRLVESLVLWIGNSWRPRFLFSLGDLLAILRFGSSVTLSKIFNFINKYGGDFMIGLLLGSVQVGLFNFAFRITRTIVELLGSVITKVAFPTFSKLQTEKERGKRFFYRAIQQISLLSMPVFSGLMIVSKPLVRVVFGDKWLPSVPSMRVLALIGILQTFIYINNSLILAYGKPSWKTSLDGINAFLNIILFYLFAERGIIAVAAVYVIRGYITAPFYLIAVNRLVKIDYLEIIKNVLPALIGSAAMSISLLIFNLLFVSKLPNILHFSILLLIGCVVYFSVIYWGYRELYRETSSYFINIVRLGHNG